MNAEMEFREGGLNQSKAHTHVPVVNSTAHGLEGRREKTHTSVAVRTAMMLARV